MKKIIPPGLPKLLLVITLLCAFATGHTQYVTIPDTTFVNWLKTNGYSSCFNGSNQLDTTCTNVTSATTLSPYAVSIRDLTGIQYFKNLRTLDCSNDSLDNIPAFPPLLTSLNCQYNLLRSLPALPSSLTSLVTGYNYHLQSLPALPAGLLTMQCNYDSLTALPALPSTLTNINCENNRIAALPTLPSALNFFYGSNNSLTSLPALPASLEYLDCGYNNISSIPALPANLYYLDCSYNTTITVLPALAGTVLVTLYCGGNELDTLPPFPSTMQTLDCSENLYIRNIPPLPAGFTTLRFTDNSITKLPPLPSSLTYLGGGGNYLDSLPDPLPDSLQYLGVAYNNLVTLPPFPLHLSQVQAFNNPNLTSLPPLPDALGSLLVNNCPNLTCLPELKEIGTLNFSGTGVTCLPDYGIISSCTPPLGSLPLCGIYNTTGCQAFWNISGQCYYDANSNCLFDSFDVGTNYVKTQLYNGSNLVQQTFSGGEGYYSFDSVPYGTYTVQVDTTNLPFTIECPAGGEYYDTISAIDSFIYNNHFAFKCRTQGFDVGVNSIMSYIIARPNSTITLLTSAGDISELYGAHCAAGIGGQVQLSYTGSVQYVGPATGALAPTSINGNTISWTIADYGAIDDNTAFNLQFKVDSLATAGSQVCITLNVSPTAGDYNPANNTATYCFNVVNALDPNEKEAYPSGNTDTSFHWITYTLHFQNTGSAAALNIKIIDTLDTNLDPSTFQLLKYSANNLTQILGNVVIFNFPNINLPDSAVSDSLSRGFVQYKIRLKDNLPIGTQIDNTGYIYFDLNNPVTTNTTINTITVPTGINQLSGDVAVKVYPNPSVGSWQLAVGDDLIGARYEVYNATGQLVLKSEIRNPQSEIELPGAASGVYELRIITGEGIVVRKLVKM